MATRRKKRRTKKKTTRTARRTAKKGNGKSRVPKGFVLVSKNAAKKLTKSYKALSDAMNHMIAAENENVKARSRYGL